MELVMNNTERGRRRSEQLSKDDHKAFIKLYHSFPTKIDAQVYFDLKRQILDMIAIKGSGSPESVGKIRERLDKIKAA
jgi:hypothetical protein